MLSDALLDTLKASQLFDCKTVSFDLMISHNQTFALSQELICRQWSVISTTSQHLQYQLFPPQRLFSFRADVRWADHKLSCSEKNCDTVTILRLNVIYGSQACIDVGNVNCICTFLFIIICRFVTPGLLASNKDRLRVSLVSWTFWSEMMSFTLRSSIHVLFPSNFPGSFSFWNTEMPEGYQWL